MRKRTPTLRDVALHCSVSPMTVSFVLNNKPGEVGAATRDRVLKAASELGYRPNRTAQALATGRSRSITLWMKTVFPSYSAQIIHHIREQMAGTDMNLNIWDMPSFGKTKAESRDSHVPQWQADGIIAVEAKPWVDYVTAHGSGLTCPIVSLGSECSHAADYVELDLAMGTRQAISHLVETGRTRIAYVLPERADRMGDARRDAYCETIRHASLTEEFIIAPASSPLSGYSTLKDRLSDGHLPDAIFCYNDELAIGVNRALREFGIRVPEDVALVGCDGIDETEYQHPALSTIVLPLEAMCQIGWEFLKNRLLNPAAPPQTATLPTHLLVRESSSIQQKTSPSQRATTELRNAQ